MMSKAKMRYYYSAAHELKAPLFSLITAISQYSRFVTQEGLYLYTVISKSAEYLSNVLTDINDMGKIENGQFKLIAEWVNPG